MAVKVSGLHQHVADEERDDRHEQDQEQRRREGAQPGQRVFDPAHRPGEVERQHRVALVAADELRGLGHAEEEDQEVEAGEVVVVGEQLDRLGRKASSGCGDDRGEGQLDHGRKRIKPGQDERRRLGAHRPAEAPDAAQALDEERPRRHTGGRSACLRSGGSPGRRCCRSDRLSPMRRWRPDYGCSLASPRRRGGVTEEVFEAAALLLDADQRQAEIGHGVTDRVVEGVPVQHDQHAGPVHLSPRPSGRQGGRQTVGPILHLDRQDRRPLREVRDRRRLQQVAAVDRQKECADLLDLAQEVTRPRPR